MTLEKNKNNNNATGKLTFMDPLYNHIADAKAFEVRTLIKICPHLHRQRPIAWTRQHHLASRYSIGLLLEPRVFFVRYLTALLCASLCI